MAIFRGTGGPGDSTTDTTVTTVTQKAVEAAASATAAASSASSASSSATSALTSATNAATSETNAATSATSAANSATSASTSATTASSAATSASTAQTAAETAQTAAEAAQTAAETAETNAASSASSASSSASSASTSATNASNSASAASTSETNAATSASDAADSATAAETAQSAAESAQASAEAAFDDFDDRYLGAKASDPSTDNDGDALVAGALYFNTTNDNMNVYTGSEWKIAYVSLGGALLADNNLDDLTNAATARTNLGLGTAATTASTDYATAAQGSLADSAVQPGDNVSDLTNDAGYLTSETYTGTVTSVAATVPTGLTVSGSPITTSGTLSIAYDTGYSIPTDASQSNWDTAYGWGDHSTAGYLTSYTETDPVVGAINGIVKANGAGTISAAVAGTDYLTTNQTITLSGDITGSGTTAITTSIAANSVGITELDVTDGTSGQVLSTNGSGVLSFVDQSGGGGTEVNCQVFTSSGTWTPSTDYTYAIIYCTGGGGAGGGAGGDVEGTGGGSGATAIKTVSLSGLSSQTITIGSGGAGVLNGTGGSGGTSSVGALCSATGGGGGALATKKGGGYGGTATGGDINIGGGQGAGVSGTGSDLSGAGSASFWGGGGGGSDTTSTASDGTDAQAYGAGGSGAMTQNANQYTGGDGADGIVVIWEYK